MTMTAKSIIAGIAIAVMLKPRLIRTMAGSEKRTPITQIASVESPDRCSIPARIEAVSATWKANQPVTSEPSNAPGITAPQRPKTASSTSCELKPQRPAAKPIAAE